jgi:glycosyltransferase involved in cell wall biosynthesis
VRLLGYLADSDKRSFLGGAEVVSYPSIAEGFGLPVLEAMACGAPVVTSGVSATAEVAGDAAELVDPLATESIEAGLRRVLADPARARELRTRGLERAAQFSWEAAAERTLAVYRRAMG